MTDRYRFDHNGGSEETATTAASVNPVDDIRQLARDIEQSFGMYTLASFEHIDGNV